MSTLKTPMKSSSALSIVQSKTLSAFPDRKRVFSMKSIRRPLVLGDGGQSSKDLLRLERALEKDNRKASRLISQPEATIPGFEEMTIDHKLWKYFQIRMQSVKSKVEKQRVNFCEREFEEIKELIDRKRAGHRYQLQATQKVIKDKYKQIHELFEEIKQEKLSRFITTVKKKPSLATPANTEKIVVIKDNIENIRAELMRLESQYKSELQEEERLTKEWISLLTNMTKHAYFMKDGFNTLFKEMIKLEYVPAKEDFPDFADLTTYKCFIKRYEHLKDLERRQREDREKQKSKTRHVSASIKQIRQIAKQPQLSKIYQGTREYMVDWVRNQSWKEAWQLPKIQAREQVCGNDWEGEERKRMKVVYADLDVLRTLKSMLFGPKVEIQAE